MRSNVETRKCHGCNAILSLRESCPRCAAAERARLHAAGFCRQDGTGQPYDCGKPPLGTKPDWASLKLPERRGYFCVPPLTTPQDIGEMAADEAIEEARKMGLSGHEADVYINRRAREAYDEAAQDEARTRRELVGMDFGYQPIKYVKEFVGPSVTRAELDRAIAAITKPKHEPPKDNCQCSPCIVRRLDPGWEHHRGCGTACLRRNEPPPVGAEVSWEVAKADMMARPVVAVYTNTGWPKAEFHWDGELKVLPPREERFIKAEIYAPGEARWVRLA